MAQANLKKVEQHYYLVKNAAELKATELKTKTGFGHQFEEFEKELANFTTNYSVMMKLLADKPFYCEQVINELEKAVIFFETHILKSVK